ncbi:diguanylate cyclase (GGDEF)-like protein [Amorphus suaedae]
MMSADHAERPIPLSAAERAQKRRKEIEDFGALDDDLVEVLDRISRIASAALRMPITHVSFLDDDRQWVRAAVGLDRMDLPLEDSLCIHVIDAGELLVVEDPENDDRFRNNRYVVGAPGVRFYAGAPLITDNDVPIGTLCAIDSNRRNFSPEERAILSDLAELTMHMLELGRAVLVDGLTGSWNRRMLARVVAAEFHRSSRTGRTFSIAMLDLDHFKQLNDTYGHGAGDDVLVRFTDLIRERLRPEDWLFRLGGEEFGVLIVHAGVQEASTVIDRVRAALAAEGPVAQTKALTFSAGIAEHRPGTSSSDTLKSMLDRADKALYRAKESGRDRTICEPSYRH